MESSPNGTVDQIAESARHVHELVREPESRRKLLDITALSHLFQRCIVSETFKLYDDWTEPIVLTKHGITAAAELRRRNARLKPHECKMAVFLAVGNSGGLFVDCETDTDRLRLHASNEMVARRIHYPYIFGRELHDVAAEMHPEKTTLSNRETLKLLNSLPIGVFQAGRFVTGPFGILVSAADRALYCTSAVPGYLCSDAACDAIHPMQLHTGDSAISKASAKLRDVARKESGFARDDNIPVINEARLAAMDYWNAPLGSNIPELIADGLVIEEQRAYLSALLRQELPIGDTRARLNKALGRLVTNPDDFAQTLGTAEILQLTLLFSDRRIERALDSSVESRLIDLAAGERRTSKIQRWESSGRAELGSLGLRLTGKSPDHVGRRLYELLHQLYFASEQLDSADLEYFLQVEPGSSESDLLAQAVRDYSPEVLLERLVSVTRQTNQAALDFLNIEGGSSHSRDTTSRMLWKIGAPVSPNLGQLNELEMYVAEVVSSLQDGDEAHVRGLLSNVYTCLESSLSAALSFAVWALLNDHYMDDDAFVYKRESLYFGILDSHSPTVGAELVLTSDGKNTLAPLAAGYGRFAKVLKSLDAPNHARWVRPPSHVPEQCRNSSRPFAFMHTVPFLDLTDSARRTLVADVTRVAQVASDTGILSVRNSALHGNNRFPDVDDIRVAMVKIEDCRRLLERSGLYPIVFSHRETVQDAWGRRRSTYTASRSEVVLDRPQWPVSRKMPIKGSQLIIVPSGQIPSCGPLRFRIQDHDPTREYWDGWPRRWRIVDHYEAEEGQKNLNVEGSDPLSA